MIWYGGKGMGRQIVAMLAVLTALSARLSRRGLAHTVFLNIGGRLAHSGDKDKAISEGLHAPGTASRRILSRRTTDG